VLAAVRVSRPVSCPPSFVGCGCLFRYWPPVDRTGRQQFLFFLLKRPVFVRPTRCVVTSIYGLAQHRGFLHINFLLISGNGLVILMKLLNTKDVGLYMIHHDWSSVL